MFDLRDIDQNADHGSDSTWRRFEAILAADRRGATPVATIAPPPTAIAPRAHAFRTGFLGGAAGVALTLAALAAIGPRPADAPAPVPAQAAAAPRPAVSDAPDPSRPAYARATPPRRAEAPDPPAFGAIRSLGTVAAIAGADAPPPPETPPATRPASEAPWVVVHVAGEAAGVTAKARRVADALRGAGFATVRVKAVPSGVARPDLRYFREADRGAARAAARAVDAALPRAAVRDFTHYRPTPEAGLIEVWVD